MQRLLCGDHNALHRLSNSFVTLQQTITTVASPPVPPAQRRHLQLATINLLHCAAHTTPDSLPPISTQQNSSISSFGITPHPAETVFCSIVSGHSSAFSTNYFSQSLTRTLNMSYINNQKYPSTSTTNARQPAKNTTPTNPHSASTHPQENPHNPKTSSPPMHLPSSP